MLKMREVHKYLFVLITPALGEKRGISMFQRILVPLDGSPFAEAALAPASALAGRFGAGLLLVRTILVHAFPGADPGPAQLEALQEAERYIDGVAHPLREQGIA